jgi:hypothetical protein
LESKLFRMEHRLGITSMVDSQPLNCGRGVRVTPDMGNLAWSNRCSEHGHECWIRDSAYDMAGAVMILAALKRHEPEPDYSNPPVWLLDECRQVVLDRGIELYVEHN